MATWDTEALLTEIRDRSLAPASSTSAPGWEDADLLRRTHGYVRELAERLRRVRTGAFRTTKDTTFTSGTASYRIPTRAMNGLVALVRRIDSTGAVCGLDKWDESDLDDKVPTTTGTPTAFLFRGNSVVLYPTPDNSSESVRMTYYRRPNKLVASNLAGSGDVGVVSSKSATQVVLTSSAPSSFGAGTPVALDFIQASPPFDSLGDDATPSSISSATLTFAAGVIPSALAVGDYVCVAHAAPVLQMPVEAFYVLAQMVANELQASDPVRLQEGQRVLTSLLADLSGAATDRDDAEPAHLSNRTWA